MTDIVLCDVNVFVYAHREDAYRHSEYRDWLDKRISGFEAFGLSDIVMSGFIRVVTNPRIFEIPTPLETAFEFVEGIREHENVVAVSPGPRHWEIFEIVANAGDAKGNLVADAYLAALAIESGCELISSDRDFARFADLRWRHPLGR